MPEKDTGAFRRRVIIHSENSTLTTRRNRRVGNDAPCRCAGTVQPDKETGYEAACVASAMELTFRESRETLREAFFL